MRETRPSRGRVLVVLCTIVPVLMLGQGLLSPVLPAYGQSLGVGAAAVGLLMTAFGLGRLLMDVPAGHLAQRLGRRRPIVAGPTIVAIGSLLCYLARSFPALVAFRFVMGVGTAVYTTTAMTALVDVTRSERRGRVMSVYQGAFLLGSGLGPALGGYAAAWMGYRAPFLICALLAAASALWAFFSVPETRTDRSAEAKEATRSTGLVSSRGQPALREVRGLVANANFALIAAVTFSIFFTRTGSRMTVIPLLGYSELGLTEVQVGFLLSTVAALNFATLYPAGMIADKIGRKAAIVPAVLVAALALVCFASARGFGQFMWGAMLLGVGTGLAGGTPAAYVSDIAPAVSSGLAMGAYRMVGDVGFVLGPVLLGAAADAVGYRGSLLMNAGLLVASSALFALFARETLRARRPAVGAPADA